MTLFRIFNSTPTAAIAFPDTAAPTHERQRKMPEELKILKERGRQLLLPVPGKRLSGGGVVQLPAPLGPHVLATLPLPKGPTRREEGGPEPARTASKKPSGV